MSTVVLTPTHIAADHNVVDRCFPHQTRVDINHPKIFIAPNKKFLIGTVGEYIPEQINTPETFEILGSILIDLIAQNIEYGFSRNLSLLTFEKVWQAYEKIFDDTAYTFLVTRHHRFNIQKTKKTNAWVAQRIGDYAGIGSGGMIAAGMLLGKMPLPEIWKPLHTLDRLTSIEHTSVPLSILERSSSAIKGSKERMKL